MPMIKGFSRFSHFSRFTFLLVLIVASCRLHAPVSAQPASPPNPPDVHDTVNARYKQVSCKKKVPAPYTGPLQVQSKYDQSDTSKSTLTTSVSDQSVAIQRAISDYTKRLPAFADYYLDNSQPAQRDMALACLDQWLQGWAVAQAITSRDASKTGMAVRKWALAAIASTVHKIQILSERNFQLTTPQRVWLKQLADIVIADYQYRQQADFAYFNNHDYWAAWAVTATGLVLENTTLVDWGDRNLRQGLQQIKPVPGATAMGHLPNESGRGALAANYTHYALVPLVLLYDAGLAQGKLYSAAEQEKLQSLARFAVAQILEPQTTSSLNQQKQEAVPAYKMAWLIPFLARFPGHPQARRLYEFKDGAVDGYSQIGGRIKPLYPKV
jgi:poly(beta-D-mannuronate) lyase